MANGNVICCGVIPTKAVKTFGSGDAYAAGLMYGILRENDLKINRDARRDLDLMH